MKLALTLVATTLIAIAVPTHAQHSHGGAGAKPVAQSSAAELADGEIRRIDPAKGTILLKHGEIKSINMGAMTMAFKLKDASMASGLKAGDKVKFAVEQKGEELLITQIRKVN
jgi:Cu/Ag efflux protein CusF